MKAIDKIRTDPDSLRSHYDLDKLEIVVYGPGWSTKRLPKDRKAIHPVAPKRQADGQMVLRRELSQRAKTIPKAERKQFLEALRETEIHVYLKELFQVMQ